MGGGMVFPSGVNLCGSGDDEQALDPPSSACLVRIESVEMSRYDWNRHGEGENPGYGADGSDYLSQRSHWHLVSVSDRRHGDDRPPEGVRDAGNLRPGDAEFGIVDGAGEDEHAD